MIKINNIIIFIFLTISTYSQEYNFINYGVREGLAQSHVLDIIQDEKSFIWMATEGGGVTRFDGKYFELLTSDDGLPSDFVNVIYQHGHDLWIGTSNGFCRYRNGHVDLIRKVDLEIFDIVMLNDSTLWFGTDEGIYSFDLENNQFGKEDDLSSLKDIRINKLLKQDNVLLIATEKGLYRKINNEIELLSIGKENADVRDLVGYKDYVVLACYGQGLIVLDKNRMNNLVDLFSSKESLRFAQVLRHIDGELWVGTKDNGIGVYNFSSSTWRHIEVQEGLSDNNVRSISQDRMGRTWIGTEGGGASVYVGQNFDDFSNIDGLTGRRVYAVAQDENENLWLSIDNGDISVLEKDGLKFNIDADLISNRCSHINADEYGAIWFSTDGQGLFRLDSSGYSVFTVSEGLTSNRIRSTAMDDDGVLWVASYSNGVTKIYENDSLAVHDLMSANLQDLSFSTLQKDNLGRIWFGAQDGTVGYFEDGGATYFSEAHGVPKVPIRSLAFDRKDNLWLGTAGEGIYKSVSKNQEIHFEQIEQNFSLTSRNINFLLFDREENLWSGSERGIDRLSMNESGFTSDIAHFGKNEGFSGVNTFHNATTLDRDGNLLIGTFNGLTKHVVSKSENQTSLPVIYFTNTLLGYQSIYLTEYKHLVGGDGAFIEEIPFPYNHRKLGFSFRGISLAAPESLKYSWRMFPVDSIWSPWSDVTSVNFSNLSSGKYSFQVKVQNSYRQESKVAQQNFNIAVPFWQRCWFYVLCIGSLVLFFWLLYSLRIKKLKEEEGVRIATMKLQNDLLGLEQKALQLQMNPHFIFNALNSIQSLVVQKKTDVARKQMQTFALLMRGLLNNSKQERISLQDEYETLVNYLSMEQFCQSQKFDFEIGLPTEYPAEEIEIPPMMIQPFVENAIIHGVAHQDGLGKIEIEFRSKGQLLYCSIRDNGVGRERSKELSVKSTKSHKSSAINITQRRLEALRRGKEV